MPALFIWLAHTASFFLGERRLTAPPGSPVQTPFPNRINQIARSVNAGIARAEDAKRGLFLLDQVYELMYQIAKK